MLDSGKKLKRGGKGVAGVGGTVVEENGVKNITVLVLWEEGRKEGTNKEREWKDTGEGER